MCELSAYHVWTDASGSFRCGAWLPATGEWLQLGWAETAKPGDLETQGSGIAWKELLPIVLACAVWEECWSRGVVTFHCDNIAAVVVVTQGTAELPGSCTC